MISVSRILYKLNIRKKFVPGIGKIHFGDLYRTTPMNRNYGINRGGAIDRVYIEDFLQKNQHLIKGRTLEVANNDYTIKYGGSNVTRSDILNLDWSNKKTTIVADLGKPLTIKENVFDCIVLTQTLQFIYDYRKAVENCYRLLKPGGHLLLTVPGITLIGKDPFNWYWSFTSFSMREIISEQFTPEDVNIVAYGNVLSASAFLYGIGRNEIRISDLMKYDPSYQVIVAVAAKKQ